MGPTGAEGPKGGGCSSAGGESSLGLLIALFGMAIRRRRV
jgi:uncharacterized protein (TIGR03382 family)